MFQKDRTGSENVQEQKRKGDRDSHLSFLRKLEQVQKMFRKRNGKEIESHI